MGVTQQRRIYLDYQASTPCDPRVVEVMLQYMVAGYGNPSSSHWAGNEAEEAVEHARESVATVLGCLPSELYFTSGATEANNIAILGCRPAQEAHRRKIIVSPIEHKSVQLPCERLASEGFKLLKCPVRGDGIIDLGALAELADEETLLVSAQLANNEIGTIQPLLEVCQIARRVGAVVHCDAAQAFGRLPIDVESLGVDSLSLSAHKCYGPKGAGALYVRGGVGLGRLTPIALGGGQEGGIRPGTLNVPGIVGLGEAARIGAEVLKEESRRVASLRERFERRLRQSLPQVSFNGALDRRLPGATSVTFPGVDAEAILANVPELAISSSSACNAGAPEPSHVLRSIGLTRDQAYSTLRISFGRFSIADEVDYAADRLAEVVRRIRSMSCEGL